MIKTPKEIKKIRKACKLAADTLCRVGEIIKPGITTEDINTFVHADTLEKSAIPAPLKYTTHASIPPFPKSVCTSVNNVVCHGIPSPAVVLQEGDIINVDITHKFKKFHGDTSATFYVGKVSEEAHKLVEVTREALQKGIATVRPGNFIEDIGRVIEEYVNSEGFSVVMDFTGHGIGRAFHEPPVVPHWNKFCREIEMKPGMIFTIEPMVNQGSSACHILDDKWTAVTFDGKLSAQFEHTILVTERGHEILTARDRPLVNSEDYK